MVGASAQPVVARPGARCRGVALPAALTGMVALGVLVSGVWVIVDLNAKTSLNRESAVRALLVAEAGASHGLGLLRTRLKDSSLTRLLRGSDNAANTADDGLLAGYGLSGDEEIPAAGRAFGGGTYFVQLVDDPADPDTDPFTDRNSRIVASCRGVMPDGGAAAIDVVIGTTPLPGMVSDGRLEVSGSPEILGPCGSLHANEIVVVQGTPTVEQGVSASDTVQVSGQIKDPSGGKVQPLHHVPPVEIPQVDPMSYCGDADFTLRSDGTFIVNGPPEVVYDASSAVVYGWRLSSTAPPKWDVSGNDMASGTYCVEGNVSISGNPQGPGGGAVPLTILATGSVEFSGNPTIIPDHPDGILVAAGGDLKIAGNPGTLENYRGSIYAKSQCEISGNPTLAGHVVCDDETNAAGAIEWATANKINGSPKITYDCGGAFARNRRIVSWYQRLGT